MITLWCGCCMAMRPAKKGHNCDALVCEEYHCMTCGNTLYEGDTEIPEQYRDNN